MTDSEEVVPYGEGMRAIKIHMSISYPGVSGVFWVDADLDANHIELFAQSAPGKTSAEKWAYALKEELTAYFEELHSKIEKEQQK